MAKKTEKSIIVIKKRGVKAGVKRGTYKKKQLINDLTDDLKNEIKKYKTDKLIYDLKDEVKNEVSNIQENINVTENINNESTQETKVNEVHKDIVIEKSEGEISLENFLTEHGTNEEFKENEEEKNKLFDRSEFKKKETVNYSQNTKMIISGYMLLSIVDFIMPNLLLKILGYFDNSYKSIKASTVKLTSEQKEQLKESADEVAKFIFAEINPLAVFFIGLGTFYFGNIQEQKN